MIWCRGLLCLALVAALGLSLVAEAGGILDRRRMLSAEESVPWRGVGRVNIARFDERGMCTGTLVAPDLVLTAAHCVLAPGTGEPYAPGNIHFVAGWRLGMKAAARTAKSVTVHPRYRTAEPASLGRIGADLALIRLSRAIPESKAPAFRVAPAPATGEALTMISYRRDRAHALTRQDGCDIRGGAKGVLALGCDVTFGASGSPLFARVDGERRLIAVVSGMSRRNGEAIAWAVRVDSAMADVLAALD